MDGEQIEVAELFKYPNWNGQENNTRSGTDM